MVRLETMFPFSVLDMKRVQFAIVSNGSGGGSKPAGAAAGARNGSHEAESVDKTSLSRTKSHVPNAAEMRKVFEQFDVNNDGMICSDELRTFMEKLGFAMTDDQVKALVQTVDDDSNGSVDFDEFYRLYSSLSGPEQSADEKAEEEEHEKNLKSAFGLFDKNNDGFISVEELQLVLKSLGMKEGHSHKKCQQMIQGVDADGNGKVDFQEFKKLMSSDTFQA